MPKFGKLKELQMRSRVIFKSRFLKHFNPLDRYEFIQLCNRRKYKAGEYIYYQGDPGTGMYFIEEGAVELIVETGEDIPTAEKPRFKIDSPESFGALSIGYDMRRLSSARCLTDCVLYGFFKPDLVTLSSRHPQIGIKMLSVLNAISLKQLQITIQKLSQITNSGTSHSLQFETYYDAEKSDYNV
jgi:CRP-like cAMP-binding protein